MLKNFKILSYIPQQRCYATKIKKSVFLQKTEEIPVHKFPRSKQTDRRLYVWGCAETGALGVQKSLKKHSQKNTAYIQHPTRTQFGERYDLIDFACGYGFSAFAVKQEEGYSLFGTGINTDSQIGYHKHPGITNQPIELMIYPAPIELPKSHMNEKIQIKLCAAGRAHLIALSDTGIVFTLGNNSYGQCGRKIVDDEMYFANRTINRIDNLYDVRNNKEFIKTVTCGQDHSIFLCESGNVYSCGWGADGQTGLGYFDIVDRPTIVRGDISREKIIKVSGTVDCVLALSDKGEVFGWGNNEYHQINISNDDLQQINTPQYLKFTKELGKIIDIAAGGCYCLVLNENGDVFIWGYGILGFGPAVEYSKKPKHLPLTLFGRNEFNKDCYITSIYSGISHIGAITNQQDLYMWGKNKLGCLGLGHLNDQFFPFKISIGAKVLKISCGVDHTLAYCKAFI